MGCCYSHESGDDDSAAASPLLGDREVPSYTQEPQLPSNPSSDTLTRQAQDDSEYQRHIVSKTEHELIQATPFTQYNPKSSADINHQAAVYRELMKQYDPEEDPRPRESIDLAEHSVPSRTARPAPPPEGRPRTQTAVGDPSPATVVPRPGVAGSGSPSRRPRSYGGRGRFPSLSLSATPTVCDPRTLFAEGIVRDDDRRLIMQTMDALETALQQDQIQFVGKVVVPLTWQTSP